MSFQKEKDGKKVVTEVLAVYLINFWVMFLKLKKFQFYFHAFGKEKIVDSSL